MKRALFESDYALGTYLTIVQTDDGDIILKIIGNGEMRIATSGGKLQGKDLVNCVRGFEKAINAMNRQAEGEDIWEDEKEGNEKRRMYQAAAVIREICNSRKEDDPCASCQFYSMCGTDPYTWEIPGEGSQKP